VDHRGRRSLLFVPRQHPLRVQQQEPEQVVLGGAELDHGPAPADLVRVLVHLQVRVPELRGALLAGAASPAEDGPDAGHHLLQAERLRDVVVPPEGEAADLVLGGVAGRQEDHGHVLAKARRDLRSHPPLRDGPVLRFPPELPLIYCE